MFVNDPGTPVIPFADEVRSLRALSDARGPGQAYDVMSHAMRIVFRKYRVDHLTIGRDTPLTAIDGFLEHLERLQNTLPTPEELANAPTLSGWCVVVWAKTHCLLGRVNGHPKLGDDARIATSALLRISGDRSYARTWSRFYALRDYAPGPVCAWKSQGLITSSDGLIDLK